MAFLFIIIYILILIYYLCNILKLNIIFNKLYYLFSYYYFCLFVCLFTERNLFSFSGKSTYTRIIRFQAVQLFYAALFIIHAKIQFGFCFHFTNPRGLMKKYSQFSSYT